MRKRETHMIGNEVWQEIVKNVPKVKNILKELEYREKQ
jgi:hypothetical protein